MSRTVKGSKAPGYDFWSRRPGGKCGYGKYEKQKTHEMERMQDKEIIRDELKALDQEEASNG
jgi:hypothetical protein